MRYQESLRVTDPVIEQPHNITIFGRPKEDTSPPMVSLHINCNGMFFIHSLKPSEARALANHLTQAAEVAEHGDGKIIPFALDRAKEAPAAEPCVEA